VRGNERKDMGSKMTPEGAKKVTCSRKEKTDRMEVSVLNDHVQRKTASKEQRGGESKSSEGVKRPKEKNGKDEPRRKINLSKYKLRREGSTVKH